MCAEADRTPAEVARGVKGPKGFGRGLAGAVREVGEDLVTVCRHPVYVCTVGGQTLYTGASINSLLQIKHKRYVLTQCWRSLLLCLLYIPFAGETCALSGCSRYI